MHAEGGLPREPEAQTQFPWGAGGWHSGAAEDGAAATVTRDQGVAVWAWRGHEGAAGAVKEQ